MPTLNVERIEGVFTPKQEHEMIRKLTDTIVSVEGENLRPVACVIIEEGKSGSLPVAGHPLTAKNVKALAAGHPKG